MIARRIVFAIGATALCGAMLANFAGVVGRAFGWNPLGLVEAVQVFVVAAISASLVIATMEGAHASVQMLSARLGPLAVRRLARLSDGLGFVFFAAVTAGMAWMLWDTWPLGERTDVLGLPVAPERVVGILAMGWISLLFLAALFRRRDEDRHADRT